MLDGVLKSIWQCLSFSCRSSPKIFGCLSEALYWILLNKCKLPFIFFLTKYSFPKEKNIGPSTHLEFLGLILDSKAMQASLPEEKINRICQIISKFESVRSLSKFDMLSLLGHFSFNTFETSSSHKFFTDAAPSIGFRGLFGNK